MIRSKAAFRMFNLRGMFLLTVWMCCSCTLAHVSESKARPTATVAVASKPVNDWVGTPPDRYLSHIALLAHDELGGRSTGSDGIDLAAGYIAGQFAAAGLKPGGPGGTYFQDYDIDRGAEIHDATDLAFTGVDVDTVLKEDFTPFGFSAKGSFSGGVAFVGYGITAEDADHDDYAGVDVKGRFALMLRRQPPNFDPDDGVSHANFSTKIKRAAEHGAAGVLVVNQDPGEDGIDGLMRFSAKDEDYGLPALHIKRSVADAILDAAGLPSITKLQNRIDEEGANVSAPLPGIRVSGSVAYGAEKMAARNVIGVLPGNSGSADEYIVIGGHYDHVGVKRGRVYNGADDNASGTAGVIELAWALARAPRRDRGVIFMAFSGEEIGLLGSKHFADEPTVDRDSIIAMINLDMIGRLNKDAEAEENTLTIQGVGTGDSFEEIAVHHVEELDIPYWLERSARGPSDHASFYKAGIPALFFNTGGHMDLHQPSDDVETINAEGAVRVIELIRRVALDLMNAEKRPEYIEVSERAQFSRTPLGPRAGGVVIGIMPEMSDDSEQPGWLIARVFADGGAEKAGMKAGDRILSVDGHTVNGFRDYREATRGKKAGEIVEVMVKRGSKTIPFHVELSSRGN